MQCNVCHREIEGEKYLRITSPAMKQAIRAGFNPFQTPGIDMTEYEKDNPPGEDAGSAHDEWRAKAEERGTDWVTCTTCGAAASARLSPDATVGIIEEKITEEESEKAAEGEEEVVLEEDKWRIVQDGQVVAAEATAEEAREMILDGRIRSSATAKKKLKKGEEGKSEEKPLLKSDLANAGPVAGLVKPFNHYFKTGTFVTAILLTIAGYFIGFVISAQQMLEMELWQAIAFAVVFAIVYLLMGATGGGGSIVVAIVGGLILIAISGGQINFMFIAGMFVGAAIGIFVLFLVMLIPGCLVGLISGAIGKSRAQSIPPGFYS